mmetsp:Transcript_25235/g.49641  ORF Transcript_25235/g.49641 Transcript_25235/m.49641 type:complete len:1275 (-) Transcript_25235:135-3959(-)
MKIFNGILISLFITSTAAQSCSTFPDDAACNPFQFCKRSPVNGLRSCTARSNIGSPCTQPGLVAEWNQKVCVIGASCGPAGTCVSSTPPLPGTTSSPPGAGVIGTPPPIPTIPSSTPPAQPVSPCSSDQDCSAVQYCALVTTGMANKQCKPRVPLGGACGPLSGDPRPCLSESMCLDSICKMRACESATSCEQCTQLFLAGSYTQPCNWNINPLQKSKGHCGSFCEAGMSCRNHVSSCAAPLSCSVDSNCPDTHFCKPPAAFAWYGQCFPRASEGAQCETNTQTASWTSVKCKIGLQCHGGRCITAASFLNACVYNTCTACAQVSGCFWNPSPTTSSIIAGPVGNAGNGGSCSTSCSGTNCIQRASTCPAVYTDLCSSATSCATCTNSACVWQVQQGLLGLTTGVCKQKCSASSSTFTSTTYTYNYGRLNRRQPPDLSSSTADSAPPPSADAGASAPPLADTTSASLPPPLSSSDTTSSSSSTAPPGATSTTPPTFSSSDSPPVSSASAPPFDGSSSAPPSSSSPPLNTPPIQFPVTVEPPTSLSAPQPPISTTATTPTPATAVTYATLSNANTRECPIGFSPVQTAELCEVFSNLLDMPYIRTATSSSTASYSAAFTPACYAAAGGTTRFDSNWGGMQELKVVCQNKVFGTTSNATVTTGSTLSNSFPVESRFVIEVQGSVALFGASTQQQFLAEFSTRTGVQQSNLKITSIRSGSVIIDLTMSTRSFNEANIVKSIVTSSSFSLPSFSVIRAYDGNGGSPTAGSSNTNTVSACVYAAYQCPAAPVPAPTSPPATSSVPNTATQIANTATAGQLPYNSLSTTQAAKAATCRSLYSCSECAAADCTWNGFSKTCDVSCTGTPSQCSTKQNNLCFADRCTMNKDCNSCAFSSGCVWHDVFSSPVTATTFRLPSQIQQKKSYCASVCDVPSSTTAIAAGVACISASKGKCPKPVNQCYCGSFIQPVCANGRDFSNPCFAECAGYPTGNYALGTCAQFTSSVQSCFGNCGKIGVGGCYCDLTCQQRGDCCSDYAQMCLYSVGAIVSGVTNVISNGAVSPILQTSPMANTAVTSCMGRCTETFQPGKFCYCDAACAVKNDCCSDFKSWCSPAQPQSSASASTGYSVASTTKALSCSKGCQGAGTPDLAGGGVCYCDSQCTGSGDCCSDYATFCSQQQVVQQQQQPVPQFWETPSYFYPSTYPVGFRSSSSSASSQSSSSSKKLTGSNWDSIMLAKPVGTFMYDQGTKFGRTVNLPFPELRSEEKNGKFLGKSKPFVWP